METQERDHVPPRASFFGKTWPEEFEFPACTSCNKGTRLNDQYFAWHVRMFGWDDDQRDADKENTDRLAKGIRNNQPHLLPDIPPYLEEAKWRRQRRISPNEFRGVLVRRESVDALEATFRKIAVAFYYKHVGKPLPQQAGVWSNIKINLMLESIDDLVRDMNFGGRVSVPKRNGRDFLGQFFYTHEYSESEGAFLVAGKFSSAVLGFAGCVERPETLSADFRTSVALYGLDGSRLPASPEANRMRD